MDAENRRKAEQAVRDILAAFDIKRGDRSLEETPARVIRMLEEVWEGERYSNAQIAEKFGKTFPTESYGIVVVKDIEAFSYCEHHLALMYDMKVSVGYYPEREVIGLSKIARIVDMCCKRLQLQERIGEDIADVMSRIVGESVCVRVEATHSCMTARGIKKNGCRTVTFTRKGDFSNDNCFKEFLEAIR